MITTTNLLLPKLLRPLARLGKLQQLPISSSAVRFAGPDPMLEVGPWPRTKEERDKAAKKYNLIPEDYEPYDEGDAMGDYPKLKAVGEFNRDPYDDFDEPFDRRYYGEPYHADADLYRWEGIDPLAHEKKDIPIWAKYLTIVGMTLFVPVGLWLCDYFRIQFNHPRKIRRYNGGQTMYEFPSDTDGHHH